MGPIPTVSAPANSSMAAHSEALTSPARGMRQRAATTTKRNAAATDFNTVPTGTDPLSLLVGVLSCRRRTSEDVGDTPKRAGGQRRWRAAKLRDPIRQQRGHQLRLFFHRLVVGAASEHSLDRRRAEVGQLTREKPTCQPVGDAAKLRVLAEYVGQLVEDDLLPVDLAVRSSTRITSVAGRGIHPPQGFPAVTSGGIGLMRMGRPRRSESIWRRASRL